MEEERDGVKFTWVEVNREGKPDLRLDKIECPFEKLDILPTAGFHWSNIDVKGNTFEVFLTEKDAAVCAVAKTTKLVLRWQDRTREGVVHRPALYITEMNATFEMGA